MASPLFAGSLASSAQANLTQSRDEHMLQQMQSAQGNKSDAQIDKGAKEFESMLLSTWLQQAEQSMATVPGAEEDEDGAGKDQMMSLGVQSLSTSLVASGGIGIAKMISKALHKSAENAASSPQTPQVPEENGKIGVKK
jgi:Rod binding domain-containing protein